MIYYDFYGAPDEAVDQFVRETSMGRLVTVGVDGAPHIGLYPFAISAGVDFVRAGHSRVLQGIGLGLPGDGQGVGRGVESPQTNGRQGNNHRTRIVVAEDGLVNAAT